MTSLSFGFDARGAALTEIFQSFISATATDIDVVLLPLCAFFGSLRRDPDFRSVNPPI